MIFMTFWFQVIDRSWYAFNIFDLVLAILALLYFIFFVDESPKWLQQWGRYDEARSKLKIVSDFNGVDPKYSKSMILDKEFDKEYL